MTHRTPEGIERRKAADRERKAKRYHEDAEFRLRELARRKAYHAKKSKGPDDAVRR